MAEVQQHQKKQFINTHEIIYKKQDLAWNNPQNNHHIGDCN